MPDNYESYNDYLYHNICPWCDKRYDEVNHTLGCPDPKPENQMSERAKLLYKIGTIITSGEYENA